MVKRLIAVALLTVLGLGTPIASATVIVYTAGLSDQAESPPAPSLGTGFGTITLDNVFDTMRVVVKLSPLTDNTTSRHNHCCNAVPWPGTAGIATTVPKLLELPLGIASRPYDEILALTLGSEPAGQLEPAVYLSAR
jgi:hypothetical protein